MAYRRGDRYQMMILPRSIEDYVAKDDPVRAYDGGKGRPGGVRYHHK